MSTDSSFAVSPRTRRLLHTALALGCLVFAIPLVALAYMGTFMRYSGDDWCYAAALVQNGFFKAQWVSYTIPPPFNGNRFSLTFFSNLGDLIGPYANAALPGLAVLLWVVGTALALRSVRRLFAIQAGRLPLVLGAEALVFFSLYLAPERAQSLYWRSGMLPYLAPLVAGSYLAAAILTAGVPAVEGESQAVQAVGPARTWFGLAGIGLLAWVAGGFSETGNALLVGALGLALMAALLVARRSGEGSTAHRLLRPLAIALAGALLATVMLIASPTNASRLANLPPRMGLVSLITTTLRYTVVFAYTFLRGKTLAALLLLGLGVVLGMAAGFRLRLAWAFAGLLLTGVVTVLLVAASLIPSVYIQSSYPEARALVTAVSVMILGLLTAGGLLGASVAGLLSRSPLLSRRWISALALLALAISIYPFNAAGNIVLDAPVYQKWAAFWDARHTTIRQAAMQGVDEVSVVQLDHVIPRVGELQPDPNYWYNYCAEKYYGVDVIRADQAGWDK